MSGHDEALKMDSNYCKLIHERNEALALLATERDAWGKRETELISQQIKEREAWAHTFEERGHAFQESVQKAMAENKRLGEIAEQYEHDIDELHSKAERLAEALRQCSEPTGAFSMDHGQHAKNCLEETTRIAKEALAEFEGKGK